MIPSYLYNVKPTQAALILRWTLISTVGICMACTPVTSCLINESLRLRHNECDGVSNHQPHDCLLNHIFMRRSKETSMHRVTGLCAGKSRVTGEFPAQRASNAEIDDVILIL